MMSDQTAPPALSKRALRTYEIAITDTETGEVLGTESVVAEIHTRIFDGTNVAFKAHRLPHAHLDAFEASAKDAGAWWAAKRWAWVIQFDPHCPKECKAVALALALDTNGFLVTGKIRIS